MKVIKFLVIITTVCCFGYGLCYFTKSEESYKQGFAVGRHNGIKYEKQRRNNWADSIRNNNTWNNGIPDSVRKDFKWE